MAHLGKIGLASLFAALAFPALGVLENAYFAPEGPTLFKVVLPNGLHYNFSDDGNRPGHLMSSFGWEGVYDRNGNVTLNSVSGDSLSFRHGRLVSETLGGKTTAYDYDMPRSAPTNTLTPLAFFIYDEEKLAKDYIRREEAVKWVDTGRLAFPYVNPNFSGALYAQLSLLFFVLALAAGRGVLFRAVGVVLAAATAGCVVWSGSRGAMLGLFVGAALTTGMAVKYGKLSWRLVAGVGGAVVLAIVMLVLFGHANLMRGFGEEGLAWSNALRVEMTKAAPRMMADAPGGWGSFGVGRGYSYWYQPLELILMSGTLINAHLTWLVKFGVLGRFLYLFSLFALFALAVRLVVRERFILPLAVLSGFAVMASFNPVFSEWGLWLLPGGVIMCLLWRSRGMRLKTIVLFGGSCAIGAALALYGLLAVGTSWQGYPSIAYDGRRIKINGANPRIWIVDDDQGALGGALVGRDIREFYRMVPLAPSVGYVRSIDNLPEKGVDRLVLAGKAGNDWLLRLSEDEKMRSHLPKSVLFVSPPFSPSEVPEGVLAMCHPTVLVGEFAAQYNEDYRTSRPWVKIVPAMEKYILRWMAFVVRE